MQELIYRLDEFSKNKERLEKEVKEVIADTSLALEDRWKLFLDFGELLLPCQSYCISIRAIDKRVEDFYYDVMGTERHSLIEFYEVIDTIEETGDEDFSEEDIVNIKEEILSLGLWGFRYDW